MKSTGYIIAAGAIALANDVVLAPMASKDKIDISQANWRIVPATAILALVIGGLGSISEGFGDGLGALILLSSLILPFGQGNKGPLQNLATLVQTKKV